ncbi:YdeI/OmpD-associated family protein [Paenibacillus xanthanilyticus]|uniref:YdeI family protein n=1 Tax=Paenibacillus xanthanilyticus TaxID=1783531 RepID=A0ABV8JYK2_9BACL
MARQDEGEPIFFESPAAFRQWLADNHERQRVQWVGYYKRGTGKPTMTWPESVDEALCLGWIDGLRKSIDAERYMIRFTPRKPDSIWSAVNMKRVAELTEEGRMRPEGLRAYELRKEAKSSIYAHEQDKPASLTEEEERLFRASDHAWTQFEQMAASYRKMALWWVSGAKREATRSKRLAELIEASGRGGKLAHLQWGSKKKDSAE